jgi:hypothetical protein
MKRPSVCEQAKSRLTSGLGRWRRGAPRWFRQVQREPELLPGGRGRSRRWRRRWRGRRARRAAHAVQREWVLPGTGGPVALVRVEGQFHLSAARSSRGCGRGRRARRARRTAHTVQWQRVLPGARRPIAPVGVERQLHLLPAPAPTARLVG